MGRQTILNVIVISTMSVFSVYVDGLLDFHTANGMMKVDITVQQNSERDNSYAITVINFRFFE